MTVVASNTDMTYAGIKRYKGEIFTLRGARNDDNIVRNALVRLFDEDTEDKHRADNLGRDFISLEAMARAQRDANMVSLTLSSEGEQEAPAKRKRGRPQGSKDTKPRKKAKVPA